MMDWKKAFWRLAVALAVVLVCLELAHWGDRSLDLVSEDTAMNLRQEPSAAITEEEQTMLEEALQCAAVQELLDSGEGGNIYASEDPSLQTVVERCLDQESVESVCASVFPNGEGNAVALSWRGLDREQFLVQRKESEGGPEYFKTYSRTRFPGTTVIYENWDNETVRQSAAHHWWFSWLTANW